MSNCCWETETLRFECLKLSFWVAQSSLRDQPGVLHHVSLRLSFQAACFYSLTLAYPHIWGWESAPLFRGRPHMLRLHSGLPGSNEAVFVCAALSAVHVREAQTDVRAQLVGTHPDRLLLWFSFFFLCTSLSLGFHSALRAEVCFHFHS